jgi:hypothetical protein
VIDRRVEVRPSDPCDRCNHQARRHHQRWESYVDDWHCTVRIGTDSEKQIGREKEIPIFCPCDGYVPQAAAS